MGKTTLSGTLARLFGRDGVKVLAVDADPAMNLAYALGVPRDQASKITPISENGDLIEEKTGARPGGAGGGFFKLNPKVDDLADRIGVQAPDGVRLMVMGTVKFGGGGCLCPSNALLKALLAHLMLDRGDVVVMDMEAGVEHLGRATVRGMDALLCVVEPGAQSIDVAQRITQLAKDVGVKETVFIANKVTSEEDSEIMRGHLSPLGLTITTTIPFDPDLRRADALRIPPLDYAPNSPAVRAVASLMKILRERFDAA